MLRQIAQSAIRRRAGDHHRGLFVEDRRARDDLAREILIEDFRRAEKKHVVDVVAGGVERLVGVILVKFEPALGPENRGADRAADVEVEPFGVAVRRHADESASLTKLRFGGFRRGFSHPPRILFLIALLHRPWSH